jgi:hypothetical protein
MHLARFIHEFCPQLRAALVEQPRADGQLLGDGQVPEPQADIWASTGSSSMPFSVRL